MENIITENMLILVILRMLISVLIVGDLGFTRMIERKDTKQKTITRRQDLCGSARLPTSTAALGFFYSTSRENQSYKELSIYIYKKSRVLLGLGKA